jgi:hypothetical protein
MKFNAVFAEVFIGEVLDTVSVGEVLDTVSVGEVLDTVSVGEVLDTVFFVKSLTQVRLQGEKPRLSRYLLDLRGSGQRLFVWSGCDKQGWSGSVCASWDF